MDGHVQLRLLDTFALAVGDRSVTATLSAQRLLAILAIEGRPMHRVALAGTLWPDSSDERAQGSLRSALWRLQAACRGLVEVHGPSLTIAAGVEVDIVAAAARARRLLGGAPTEEDLASDPDDLRRDLLPDWYEEWLEVPRERLRLLQVHALEALSGELRQRGRYAAAVDAAWAAVASEPMRESAQRALIEAHLAEGNRSEAVRQFHAFRIALGRELGVEPSDWLRALVQPPHVAFSVTGQ